MSRDARQEIAVRGKTKDIALLVGLLRLGKIPFRQAPTLGGGGPVICVPLSHEAQLRELLLKHKEGRTFRILTTEELNSAQTIFWIMVWGAVALISLPWLRLLLLRHH